MGVVMDEHFVEEIGELSPMEKLFILRSRRIRFGLACLRIHGGKPVKIECMDTYEEKEIISELTKLQNRDMM